MPAKKKRRVYSHPPTFGRPPRGQGPGGETEDGGIDENLAALQQAAELEPGDPRVQASLATALHARGRLDEAIAVFGRVAELIPEVAVTHANLATAQLDAGHIDEAIDSYRTALSLALRDGTTSLAFSFAWILGCQMFIRGDILESASVLEQAMELRPDVEVGSGILYSRHFDARYSAEALLAEHIRWNDRFAASITPLHLDRADRPTNRRLRVGYVSPDLRHHVVGHHLLPLLRNHDRERLEVFCYALNSNQDAITAELRSVSEHWRDLHGLPEAEAAQKIASDEIDVLVDLALHTPDNRLLIFAHKPAPVQVTYLGYCSTTGLGAMTFRLSDPYLDPADTDLANYSEKTVRLPRSYWCYEPLGDLPEPDRPAGGGIVFGSLGRPTKVSREAISAWSRILSSVPESRLRLHMPPGVAQERAADTFAADGVAADRLELVGNLPWEDYIRSYNTIDIALDPFPHGGGVTTCDALWMGVPVVTLSGGTAVGRGGRSILSNVGLPELVAQTEGEYVEIATLLARDRERLAEYHATLNERFRESPLMDAERITRDLEAAFVQMAHSVADGSG